MQTFTNMSDINEINNEEEAAAKNMSSYNKISQLALPATLQNSVNSSSQYNMSQRNWSSCDFRKDLVGGEEPTPLCFPRI